MPNNNKSNLVSLKDRTPEERKAIASMGGKKARENDVVKKTFKEALLWALDEPAFNSDDELIAQFQKKSGKKITNREAMSIALVKQALSGDVKAYQVARDTTGELPEQTVNVKNNDPMVITVQTIGETKND